MQVCVKIAFTMRQETRDHQDDIHKAPPHITHPFAVVWLACLKPDDALFVLKHQKRTLRIPSCIKAISASRAYEGCCILSSPLQTTIFSISTYSCYTISILSSSMPSFRRLGVFLFLCASFLPPTPTANVMLLCTPAPAPLPLFLHGF